MKTIKLTQGQIALIDDEMYDRVSYFKWYATKGTNTFYAKTSIKLSNDKWIEIRMHQLVTNFTHTMVDHKDGDGLNNQRENLRLANRSENQWNRKKTSKTSSSNYKGVCWNKTSNNWISTIRINNKLKYLGSFDTERDAAIAYNNAAINMFSKYAKLNVIE